jgi:large subunit ribosomal protein L16
VAHTKTTLAYGTYGLKALDYAWVTARQIEAARRTITKFLQKGGKFWIRIFPDKPITSHGNENAMGGGKGAVDHYVFPVRPGRILFEMDGISAEVAREALRLAGHKLPVKTKVVSKTD